LLVDPVGATRPVIGAAVLVIAGLGLGAGGSGADSKLGDVLWVMRRLGNGRPDRTFAGGGQQRFALGGVSEVDALVLQSSGRIVILGESSECFRECSSWHPVLLRFIGGNSKVRCMGRKATIVGTQGPDELTGTPRRDVIAALGGKDTVRGLSGADLICGGKGRDKLLGGPGHDQVRQ